ncbi:hypothetical protein [Paraflavitalea speifideaquila]|uniref:TapB family protein n=1 Tax=Paraflavitalea speifideaquila TaxID=3076558 RepID=UPI0028E7B6A3|nr:hypothetical protein [Paraflavitalea speifideiaquila]
MTNYDGNGTVTGTDSYRITSVQGTGNEINSNAQITKSKGGKVREEQGTYYCSGGILKVSVGKSKKGEEFFLVYPPDMRPGQVLGQDIDFEMESISDGKKVKVRIKINNRKVASLDEKVTTDAGTWNCVKISYNLDMRFSMGLFSIPIKLEVQEWYAPGNGVVKTESFKSGKLEERSLLTKIQ